MLRRMWCDPKLRIGGLLVGLFIVLHLYFFPGSSIQSLARSRSFSHCNANVTSALDDVLVIVKTGACEDSKRLVTQSQNSLSCAPRTIYFSDLEQRVGNLHLHDSFAGDVVEQQYMDEDDEFILYKKLQKDGSCKHITAEDMTAVDPKKNLNGNNDNRGWNLDKWKFLPVSAQAYNIRNNTKWYVEIEADTYVIWPNLVKFLSLLDAKEDHYIGSPMFTGGGAFIYGGSGIVLSQPAMHKLVEHVRENTTALQKFTHQQWAGDHIMGKALKDVGVGHTTMSREFVRDNITGADYSFHWCTAALTFHHVVGSEAAEFYDFERKWFAKNPGLILRHKDIFQNFILPQIRSSKVDWDNNAREEVSDIANTPRTIEDCKQFCFTKPECVQYRFAEGKCFTAKIPQLGRAATKQLSGWFPERAADWVKQHKHCTAQDKAWSARG